MLLSVALILLVGVVSCWTDRRDLDQCHFPATNLPGHVTPIKYQIVLEPLQEAVQGKVRIYVTVRDRPARYVPEFAPNQIVLRAPNRLTVADISYWRLNPGTNSRRKSVQITGACCDREHNIMVIDLAENLIAGSKGYLDILFSSSLDPPESSFARPKHLDKLAFINRYLARPVSLGFPSFDEPAFRAIHELSLIVKSDESVLSSMPLASCHLLPQDQPLSFKKDSSNFDSQIPSESQHERLVGSNRKLCRFEETPPIPLHLLGALIGHFKGASLTTHGKVPIRLLLHPDRTWKSSLTLVKLAATLIDKLTNLFERPFPAQKLDFVAIDGHLDSTVSNYFGLVLIKESLVLGSRFSSIKRNLIKSVVSHWLGGLVFLESWNDIWLFEAFSFWISLSLGKMFEPDSDYRLLGIHSRAIAANPKLIDEPNSIMKRQVSFDDYQMEKLVSIFSSVEVFAPDVCWLLIVNIVKHRAGQFVRASLFLDSLPQYLGQYFRAWLANEGSPTLTVEQTSARMLSIHQQPTIALDSNPGGQSQSWPLLIKLIVHKDGQLEVVKVNSKQGQTSIQVDLPEWFDSDQGHWYKVSTVDAFYRAKYGPISLAILRRNLKPQQLTKMERKSMIDDAVELTTLGSIGALELVDTLNLFKQESDLNVARSLINGLGLLRRLYFRSATLELLDWFTIEMLGHLFEQYKLARQADLPEESCKNLSLAYELLVEAGHQAFVADALAEYRSGQSGWRDRISGQTSRVAIIAAVARFGSAAEVNSIVAEYDPSAPISVRLEYLRGLASLGKSNHDVAMALIDNILKPLADTASWTASVESQVAHDAHILIHNILDRGLSVRRYLEYLASKDLKIHRHVARKLVTEEMAFFAYDLQYDQVENYCKQYNLLVTVSQLKFDSAMNLRQKNFDLETGLVERLKSSRSAAERQ